MPLPASLRTSGLFGPLILGVAVPLMLLAASGFLGMRYWHQQQAASHAVEHSRQALARIGTMGEIRSQIDQMIDHERFLLAGWETGADALEQRKTWLIASAVVIV